MADTTYELLYFGSRGRPEPVRLLLAYVGASWTDTVVAQWPALKPSTPLGQLPVLIERSASGERQIPQSGSILRHLARVFELYGFTEDERLAVDIAMDTGTDLIAGITPFGFGPQKGKDPAALSKYLDSYAPLHLTRVARLLADSTFLVGDAPTVADLVVFHALDAHVIVDPTLLDAFPTLKSLYARVADLPGLSSYLSVRRPSEFAPLASVRATGQPLA